mmetsp:Transcript_7052/g.19682  ORF Transcript_7052/g.19682 Transcript_7052/m.19682 type:complete len:378 (+) Transcript_7052:1011-2144(+)
MHPFDAVAGSVCGDVSSRICLGRRIARQVVLGLLLHLQLVVVALQNPWQDANGFSRLLPSMFAEVRQVLRTSTIVLSGQHPGRRRVGTGREGKDRSRQLELRDEVEGPSRPSALAGEHPLQLLPHPLPADLEVEAAMDLGTLRGRPNVLAEVHVVSHRKSDRPQHAERVVVEGRVRIERGHDLPRDEQIVDAPPRPILHLPRPDVVEQRIARKVPPEGILQRRAELPGLMRRDARMTLVHLLGPEIDKVDLDAMDLHGGRLQMLALRRVGRDDPDLVLLLRRRDLPRPFEMGEVGLHDRGKLHSGHVVEGHVDVVAVEIQNLVPDPPAGHPNFHLPTDAAAAAAAATVPLLPASASTSTAASGVPPFDGSSNQSGML